MLCARDGRRGRIVFCSVVKDSYPMIGNIPEVKFSQLLRTFTQTINLRSDDPGYSPPSAQRAHGYVVRNENRCDFSEHAACSLIRAPEWAVQDPKVTNFPFLVANPRTQETVIVVIPLPLQHLPHYYRRYLQVEEQVMRPVEISVQIDRILLADWVTTPKDVVRELKYKGPGIEWNQKFKELISKYDWLAIMRKNIKVQSLNKEQVRNDVSVITYDY